MKKNLLLVFLSILSIKGVFALDTFNLMVYNLPNPSIQTENAKNTNSWNIRYITTSATCTRSTPNLDTAIHRLDCRFPFIVASENSKTVSETNTNLIPVEDTHFIYYEIIGRNLISNTLNLQTNNQSFTNKKPNIFNTLGLLVKKIPINNTEMLNSNVSNLYKGLYYMTIPNLNVEPLKFVKVN